MSKLISISGSPLSGKTTLIEKLKKNLLIPIDIVSDLPRLAIDRIGLELTQFDQKAFQHYIGFAQLLAEETNVPSNTIRILDKSLIDAVAYWDVLIREPRPIWASALHAQRYAFVFICDHKDVISHGDNMQQLHKMHRDTLNEAILRVACEMTDNVKIISGDIDTRQKIVTNLIMNQIANS